MRLFTRDVRAALRWFELTHQLHGGHGWLAWQRASLPAAGGLENQPARLMEQLALIAREENDAIYRRQERDRRAETKRTKRTNRG